jgi:hypothetical protein
LPSFDQGKKLGFLREWRTLCFAQDAQVPCSYRISQEGLPLLLPFVTKQRLEPTLAEFLRIVQERTVPVDRHHTSLLTWHVFSEDVSCFRLSA